MTFYEALLFVLSQFSHSTNLATLNHHQFATTSQFVLYWIQYFLCIISSHYNFNNLCGLNNCCLIIHQEIKNCGLQRMRKIFSHSCSYIYCIYEVQFWTIVFHISCISYTQDNKDFAMSLIQKKVSGPIQRPDLNLIRAP